MGNPADNPALVRFVRAMRADYRALIPSAGTPDPVAEIETIAVPSSADDERAIPVRAYHPSDAGAGPHPIIVFAHGGGWCSGDFDTHDVLCRALANRTGAILLAVDWRLAPEHQFPAGLDDLYTVIAWAHRYGESLGGDPARLIVSGDSAGANLVTVASALSRDRKGPPIAAQLLFYPPVAGATLTASREEFGDTHFPQREVMDNVLTAYLPDGVDASNPLVAPLYGDLADLPPAFLQVGEFDPLRDEGIAYAEALSRAGVKAESKVYPRSEHGFIQFFKDKPNHPEGERALDDAVVFLREVLGATTTTQAQ
ncbi:alpha/beta hydrolase [Nocardia fluminea]|uniref:alpha/beta hydrolase n=1 Tax=Nocardia fluminea TaxID=134984 RepID=UPI0036676F34